MRVEASPGGTVLSIHEDMHMALGEARTNSLCSQRDQDKTHRLGYSLMNYLRVTSYCSNPN